MVESDAFKQMILSAEEEKKPKVGVTNITQEKTKRYHSRMKQLKRKQLSANKFAINHRKVEPPKLKGWLQVA